MIDIAKERQTEILEKVLDWFSEHFESEKLYEILTDKLVMTDEEIDCFGFDFSDLQQEKDNTFSIIHFHDFDDDYCISASGVYEIYDAIEIYCKYIKSNVGKLTLDSFAHYFSDSDCIDERIYPILCQSVNSNENFATVIDFDFENDRLVYYVGDDVFTFDLEDITKAFEKSNNNLLSEETRKLNFYSDIIQNQTEESDEAESPSMSM